MVTLDELKQEYGVNNPIFLSDITIDENYQAVRKYLSRMVAEEKIKRYCRGVYYFPKKTIFGDSTITAKQVYEKKYISNAGKIFGFHAGPGLQNYVGLTTQMSNDIIIFTNKEASLNRNVFINGFKITLKKPRTTITNDNVSTLQFLEFFSYIDEKTICNNKTKFIDFARTKGVRRDDIQKYISIYPSTTIKKIICSEVLNELT